MQSLKTKSIRSAVSHMLRGMPVIFAVFALLLSGVAQTHAQAFTCQILDQSGRAVVDTDRCDPNSVGEQQVSADGAYTFVTISPDGRRQIVREFIIGNGGGGDADGCVPAQPVCSGEDGAICIPNPLKAPSFVALIDEVATWLIIFSIPIAVLMIVWAGVLYITAGGNATRISSAHHALIWAAVGFGVVLLAKSITLIIRNFFGVEICEEQSLLQLVQFVYNIVGV